MASSDVFKAGVNVKALTKLLGLARQETNVLMTDLADIDAARRSAVEAIAELDKRLQQERNAAELQDFFAYAKGVRERRRALSVTLISLEAQRAQSQDALAKADIEVKKLEHLVGLREAAQTKRIRKKERDETDALNTVRFQKS